MPGQCPLPRLRKCLSPLVCDMLKLEKQEQEIIERFKALPLTVISRRLQEMLDELLTCREETFKAKRQSVLELKRWLATIGLFSKPVKKEKKDDFI